MLASETVKLSAATKGTHEGVVRQIPSALWVSAAACVPLLPRRQKGTLCHPLHSFKGGAPEVMPDAVFGIASAVQ